MSSAPNNRRAAHARRAVAAVVACAVLALAVLLGTRACSPGRGGGAARASSTETPMAGDAIVCELIEASRLEEIFGEPVVRYGQAYTPTNTRPGSPPQGTCFIYFTSHKIDSIEITYTSIDYFPRLKEFGGTAFEDAYNGPDAAPITADGIEGRGATWGYNLLTWSYPDGTFLEMQIDRHGPSTDGPADHTSEAAELFQQIGTTMPQRLTSPGPAPTFNTRPTTSPTPPPTRYPSESTLG